MSYTEENIKELIGRTFYVSPKLTGKPVGTKYTVSKIGTNVVYYTWPDGNFIGENYIDKGQFLKHLNEGSWIMTPQKPTKMKKFKKKDLKNLVGREFNHNFSNTNFTITKVDTEQVYLSWTDTLSGETLSADYCKSDARDFLNGGQWTLVEPTLTEKLQELSEAYYFNATGLEGVPLLESLVLVLIDLLKEHHETNN